MHCLGPPLDECHKVYCHAEHMLEPWPFALEYSHKGVQRNVSLHSKHRLNVIITPAAFRSLGDARSFVLLLSQVGCSPHMLQQDMRKFGVQ